jgi:hypothetical protein
MARKFKINKLRELHSTLGALIAESDAKMAGTAAADEDDAPPGDDVSAQAKLAAGHAQDTALHGGRELSMEEAFPGFHRRVKY